ncbi:hypothetical protein ABIC83_002752 [Roseateles asaccharophilus]|uniref:hypothetical protein n=1 Tax=Roseateles asaccharophilus TaxID=582607 RepID=UPI003832563D
MKRAEFQPLIDRINASMALGNDSQRRVDHLLMSLLETRGIWPELAILGMVYGEQGAQIANTTTRRLVEGLKPISGDLIYDSATAVPFSWLCLQNHHADLLRAIATGGIPVDRLVNGMSDTVNTAIATAARPPASTPAGRALDMMSCEEGRVNMHYVDVLLEYQLRADFRVISLTAGAKLLAELDPDHRDAPRLQGTPLGAVFTQELMLKRIASATAAGPAAPPFPAAPPAAPRTHRRAL